MDESPERRPSFYTLTDNITHIIPSRRFPRQEFRRLNRPFAENSAGVSAVLKCDDFVSSREDHVMITHDGAATNSRDTDFAAFALLTLLASVIYIVICSVRCLIDGVCQCQCGAAGCVQLLVVVLLYNLDIKTCCRQSRSCL